MAAAVLSAEIGVVQALTIEQINLLEPGHDPLAFRDEIERLFTAVTSSNSDEIRASMNNLRALSSNASGQLTIANRILKLIERRRKLVESQRKHVIALALWMDRDAAIRNADALTTALARHVRDPQTLRAVYDDLRGIIGDPVGDSGRVLI